MRLPNGFGSVHKLTGNRRKPWRARKIIGMTADRKPIFANIGYFETRKEALEKLVEYNRNPYDLKNNTITFADVFAQMINRDKLKLSASSINSYNSMYTNFASIAHMNMKEIKVMHLQKTIDEMQTGISMKNKAKILMNKVFKFALKNEIIEKNYVPFVEIVDSGSGVKRVSVPFTFDEIIYTFAHDTFHHDIVKILLCTGFRINELLALRTENIHLAEGYIVGGSKTKSGKDRTIPISLLICATIEKYYDASNEYLFTSRSGKAYSYQTFKPHFDRLYPSHTPHDTRHTFISIMDNVAGNRVAKKKIFGHSSKDITEKVYTHKTIDDLKEVMNNFDEYLSAKL